MNSKNKIANMCSAHREEKKMHKTINGLSTLADSQNSAISPEIQNAIVRNEAQYLRNNFILFELFKAIGFVSGGAALGSVFLTCQNTAPHVDAMLAIAIMIAIQSLVLITMVARHKKPNVKLRGAALLRRPA